MARVKEKRLNISSNEELKVLRKIVELTNSELDLELVLQETVRIVYEFTHADSIFIYLMEEADTLFLVASKHEHQKEIRKINLKLGEGITGWVAKAKEPVAIAKEAYQDSRFKAFDALPEDKYEAFFAVPILSKKKLIGVINLQHKEPHEFSQNTINLMVLIAKQISGAIINARMFEDAKKKALQFDSLVKVSKTITSESYLDEILNLIVVVTAEMLNSKICSIMLLDEKQQELSIKATQSLSEEYRKKPNLKVEASLSGQVIKTKKPLTIYDVRKDKKYFFRNIAIKEKLTSLISVPMIVKDKAIGIINVYTKKPHVFNEEEIEALKMIANQAAVAVENTKLMEESLKAKEALETRKLIERAKGVLMRLQGLSEEAAYRVINKKSMDSCRPMKEIAESILLMDELNKKQ